MTVFEVTLQHAIGGEAKRKRVIVTAPSRESAMEKAEAHPTATLYVAVSAVEAEGLGDGE